MKKRLSAILLALCMVLSMTPTIALADGSAATAHSHCICGATHTNVGDHTTDQSASITWTAWTSSNSLPTASGYYYLTQNANITEQWKITNGVSNDVDIVLCLNGNTITVDNANTDDPICAGVRNELSAGPCTLTITDCTSSGKITGTNTNSDLEFKHAFRVRKTGTINLYNGTITGINTGKDEGGGITVAEGGTFNMYGGTITGNTNTLTGESDDVHLHYDDLSGKTHMNACRQGYCQSNLHGR